MPSITNSTDPSNVIVVDFETFYTTEYSLNKITTQEYVLSEYFEIILVGVKLNDETTQYFTGNMLETQNWLNQFPWDDAVCVAHNAIFDGSILEWQLDIHPARYFCTMMGSRPNIVPFVPQGRMSLAAISKHLEIQEKGTYVQNARGKRRSDFSQEELIAYAAYCIGDVDNTRFIYDTAAPPLPDDEKLCIDLTIKKYTQPQLLLDYDVLLNRSANIVHEKQQALERAGLTDRKSLMSNVLFAGALENLGVVPPYKISPTTGKETYAFAKSDVQFKALLEHPDPKVQALVAARLQHKSTIEETRVKRLIDVYYSMQVAGFSEGFAIPLLYYGAHTGRFSGLDKLNLQNLGRKSELRRALIAPEGYKVVAGDLSQIEARITACLAGVKVLIQAFRDGVDVYRLFASILYDKAPEDVTPEERFMGKTCILGLGFGMGDKKFLTTVKAQGIDITSAEAFRNVRVYRSTYKGIPALWKAAQMLLVCMLEIVPKELGPVQVDASTAICPNIVLPNGLKLLYPELREERGDWYYTYRGRPTKLFGGKVVENIVQALARLVIVQAELFLAKRGYRAALSVHDELVYVIPEQKAEKFATVLEKVLTQPVPWMPELPVAAEVAIGDNYLEAK